MRELHLFAGSGGGILGGILLGHTTVCAVEIEPYCRKVLLQRQRDGILPKFPIWDDVKTFDGKPWRGFVDVVCGGFPCQDISAAGKGAGLTGARSGLWGEMARIIGEVRPGYVLVENSPLLRTRGLFQVLKGLANMGYYAKWGSFGGADSGMEVDGQRMFILATSPEVRWETFLCPYPRWGNLQAIKETPTNDDSRCWADRIHALEQMVGEPAILGSRNGMASIVDRLHATGNGQIPAVVKLAWETLINNASQS